MYMYIVHGSEDKGEGRVEKENTKLTILYKQRIKFHTNVEKKSWFSRYTNQPFP